jgi:hypothetical protein
MEKTAQEKSPLEFAISVLNSEIGKFSAKTAIILFGLFIFISLSLPDLSEIKDDLNRFNTPAIRLFVLGLVQNPMALWKYSEIQEAAGRMDSAIRDMELAIGLLEMHGADKQTMKKYSDRLENIKAKKRDSPA